jgi:hypothetical protein
MGISDHILSLFRISMWKIHPLVHATMLSNSAGLHFRNDARADLRFRDR